MNNLFNNNLKGSDASIKGKRAERFGVAAELAQKALVAGLEKEVNILKGQMDDLEDLSPDSSMSLQPIRDGKFNAETWTEALQATSIALALKEEELDIAQKNYDKYFKEIKTDKKK